MNNKTELNYITKALDRGIIKQQLQISLNKSEVNQLITEALNSESKASILRALNPILVDKFPQFPDFTNNSITEIHEDGTATVTLKVKVEKQTKESAEDEIESEKGSDDCGRVDADIVLTQAPYVDDDVNA
jgi:hypothetical protein